MPLTGSNRRLRDRGGIQLPSASRTQDERSPAAARRVITGGAAGGRPRPCPSARRRQRDGRGNQTAVASTITQLAIASGASLSTKVDFMWRRIEQLPDTLYLKEVEVTGTGYQIFEDSKVQKAIVFASTAHIGQFRRTGDPYVTHCIHTGKILPALVPTTGERAIDTVVAGILHDIIDNTAESLKSIAE